MVAIWIKVKTSPKNICKQAVMVSMKRKLHKQDEQDSQDVCAQLLQAFLFLDPPDLCEKPLLVRVFKNINSRESGTPVIHGDAQD